MADNSKEIEEIKAILNSGITSSETGDIRTTIDLDFLQRRLTALIQSDDSQKKKRPLFTTIPVGRFIP